MAKVHTEGQAQYQTMVEGLSADAWLQTWEVNNASAIRGFSGHNFNALIPPHSEPGDVESCVCQITFDYHLDGVQAEIDELVNEIACAVLGSCQTGVPPTGVVATCASGQSTAPE